MKKYLLLFVVLSTPALAFAKPVIPPAVQYFMKHVKWYAEEASGHSATILTLDYPYLDFMHPKDYFTFSLLKQYGEKRPKLFAIVLGKTVDPSKGLSLYFFKLLRPKKQPDLQSTGTITNIHPTKVNNKFISYLFRGMRYQGEDLYRHFMNKDALIAVFYDKDGTKNRVLMSYATETFPEAYRKLK